MVGADVPGRPTRARTGTTPVDDASARAAGAVGPYQHRTSHDTQRRALTARAGPRISCGAQGRMHGRGGRPRPPAPRTHKDDAGGRCVRAGRRGRRPLPTPHSRGVQGRAYHVARRAVCMVGADVLGRPPPVRTGTTPVDDASTRAAGDVGPYQRRTAVACRAAHIMWRAEPHTSCGAQNRTHHVARRAVCMVGADVPGRPPPARTRTTPVDDASTRAAEDVGPYQRRTAVVCRAAHTSCGAQDDDAHDTLTDAGSLRPSDD